MNKLFYLKGSRTGRYFVLGSGFTASTKTSASKLTEAQVIAARALGFEPSVTENVSVSFAVNYIRKGDVTWIRKGDVTWAGTVLPNVRNPSKRRFATREEANQHGSRFAVRRAKGSNVDGSAGHVGFYVTESSDPVNASVNWSTGLTNKL